MIANKPTYTFRHLASCIIMMLALGWLTISTPFVYEELKQQQSLVKQMNIEDGEEDCPLANANEEKPEGSVNTISEYLHDLHVNDHASVVIKKFYKCHPSDLYIDFHPESFSPPPEAHSA